MNNDKQRKLSNEMCIKRCNDEYYNNQPMNTNTVVNNEYVTLEKQRELIDLKMQQMRMNQNTSYMDNQAAFYNYNLLPTINKYSENKFDYGYNNLTCDKQCPVCPIYLKGNLMEISDMK